MQLIDLTHTFTKEMPVFPGDKNAVLKQVAFTNKDDYNSFYLQSGMHVGTHIDAPYHMNPNGKKLSDISLEHFIGKGKIIDARRHKIINTDILIDTNIQQNDILLICTGHDKKYRTDSYYKDYPVITEEFAKQVIKKGIKIIGFDSPSPDKAPYNTHKIFFNNNVLIIENLKGIESLINCNNFEIIAFPVKFESAGAPVRVVAKLY